jgi:UDP-GlcNAc:undecaprenyl-phosphate GlcNAc-1-phosphate transferase
VDLLLAFAAAMSITMALIPVLQRFAGRLQVLDLPDPRKVHTHPIPRVGGIAMVVGALVPLLIWLGGDPLLAAYLVAALLLVAEGVWDDRVALGYRPKLAAQVVAALIIVKWGGVLIHSVTLTDRIELPDSLAIALTMLFIVGVTNAINLSDGLDGLAGGTTLLSFCAIALLALTAQVPFAATVAITIAGSILGFLRYNTYPARIFMGDGGSQFLGFTVATLSVLLTQGDPAPFSAALPVLLLGLPILDTLMVMVQRVAEGRSPFAADKNHIHHKLLAMGFDHHEAVIVIYGLQAALFLAAWYMRFESDVLILLAFGLFAAAVLGLMFAADRLHWHWRQPRQPTARTSLVARQLRWLREPGRLPRWSLLASALGAAAYAGSVVLFCREVPSDVGWLAAAILLVLVAAEGARRVGSWAPWVAQGALYVGVVMVVFLDLRYPAPGKLPAQVEAAFFAILAASVVLSFRITAERRFRLTSLDVIVIFVALALPNLPGSLASSRALGLSALILLVLFYTTELLFNHSAATRRWLAVCAGLLLAIIAARGWIGA